MSELEIEKEAFDKILKALEGFEPQVQARLLEAARLFLGLYRPND